MPFDNNEISKNANGGTELVSRKLTKLIDGELLDNFQIIPSRVRELDETKIRILHCHDTAQDPESAKFRDKSFLNQFHKLVFVSNWQYQQYQNYHGLEYSDKCIVIDNTFELSNVKIKDKFKSTDTVRLIYTSTPQRGLEILVPVFIELVKKYSNLHLDVFSSFKIYGWDEHDKQYEPLYNIIRNHPNMTYHGFVDNTVVHQHLRTAHIFAYPCIWPETSCLALLEAMTNGCLCVHPNYAALPETTGGMNQFMYQGHSDISAHANIFAENLELTVCEILNRFSNKDVTWFTENSMFTMPQKYVNVKYDEDTIKHKWHTVMYKLLNQYQTINSRKIKTNTLIYNSGLISHSN